MKGPLVALFLVLVAIGIKTSLKQEYVVHPTGAIVVTGASTGIGRHAAMSLAKLGYVVFAGVRKDTDKKSLLDEAEQEKVKGEVIPVTLDVTSQADIHAAHATVVAYLAKKPGFPFVGLVNNAGVSFNVPFESTPLEAGRWTFDVNYWGVLATTQTFLPLIREHKGRVVSVSSVLGIVAVQGSTIYSGTKFALEAAMDSLRQEMYRFGVSVSVVEPGYIKTAIEDKGFAYKDLVSPEQYELYKTSYWDKAIKARVKNFENVPGPEITTEVIVDALVNPYPQTRYPVGGGKGFPAKLIATLVPLLPDRLTDLISSH